MLTPGRVGGNADAQPGGDMLIVRTSIPTTGEVLSKTGNESVPQNDLIGAEKPKSCAFHIA
jgi:hypothetical protein